MKLRFFIVTFFLSAISFSQNKPTINSPNYPLKVELKNLDSAKVYNHGKSYFRNLRIKLTNTADTAFSFWLMSCDWHGSVRIKPRIAGPIYTGCDKNSPEKIILKSKESYILDFKYGFSKKAVTNPVSIRAGFRVITTNMIHYSKDDNDIFSYIDYSIFSDDPKYTDKDFIWSNAIKIAF